MNEMRAVAGGCHCGAVRFSVSLPADVEAHACNCSICAAAGYIGIIVPAESFELISGEDVLTEYTFNTGVARHRFCSVCGIKSFYHPRSNPDGISINLNCLDWPERSNVAVVDFDGQNWEAHAHALAHLSRPTND
ncbi:MAG: GFA family protein [Pseudomonadota bacterium]